MKRYVVLVSTVFVAFLASRSFADSSDNWLYEFVDADVSCKMPSRGNVKLVSEIYRVCDLDHVNENGIIQASNYQLGVTARVMCGGDYDAGTPGVRVSMTQQDAEQDRSRELSARGYSGHQVFPFRYIYATQRCR